jgi:hypothetical protein
MNIASVGVKSMPRKSVLEFSGAQMLLSGLRELNRNQGIYISTDLFRVV